MERTLSLRFSILVLKRTSDPHKCVRACEWSSWPECRTVWLDSSSPREEGRERGSRAAPVGASRGQYNAPPMMDRRLPLRIIHSSKWKIIVLLITIHDCRARREEECRNACVGTCENIGIELFVLPAGLPRIFQRILTLYQHGNATSWWVICRIRKRLTRRIHSS